MDDRFPTITKKKGAFLKRSHIPVHCSGDLTTLHTDTPHTRSTHARHHRQRKDRESAQASSSLSLTVTRGGACQRPGEERVSSSPSKRASNCFSRSSISPRASSWASLSFSTMAATVPAAWERQVRVEGVGRVGSAWGSWVWEQR
eukprot:scaffold103204_cov60-Phaeocystis_antarctica.AAC.5